MAVLPDDAVTDGQSLFCKRCQYVLSNLGREDSQVSLSAHLDTIEGLHPDPVTETPRLQSKHYTLHTHDSVLALCQSKLDKNPADCEALFTLAQWHYSQGDTPNAVAILKRIIQIDADFDRAHQMLNTLNHPTDYTGHDVSKLETMGMNYLNNNHIESALSVFKQILTLSPHHIPAQRYLADIYTQMEDYQNAIHVLNRLSLQCPNDPHILFNLSVACYNAKEWSRTKSNLLHAKRHCDDRELLNEIHVFLDHINTLIANNLNS